MPMKTKSEQTAEDTERNTRRKSECHRGFEEIYKEHHLPTKAVSKRIKKNRKAYGHKGI